MHPAAANNGPDAFWNSLDPHSQTRIKVGLSVVPPADQPALANSGGPGQAGTGRLLANVWHPDNPLCWFAGLAIVTAGAMALSSGTVRARAGAGVKAGPAEVSADASV